MAADANCHKILMKALDFDEAGDKVSKNVNHKFFHLFYDSLFLDKCN